MSSQSQQTQLLSDGPATLATGEIMAARFRLTEVLGKGRQGVVYAATDLQLNVEVALKVLSGQLCSEAEKRDRLRNELLLSRSISHPNVLRVHEFYQDHHGDFYTMDKIDGHSLQQLSRQGKTLSFEQSSALITALLSALAAAHERDIYHCDIKPDNILLDSAGSPYLMDFGVATSLAKVNSYGSPLYCAPQYQIDGIASADADLFALGASLFEFFYRQPPFRGDNAEQLLADKHKGGAIARMADKNCPTVPGHRAIIRFLTALTAHQPLQRPANAAAAMALWQRCCETEQSNDTASGHRRWPGVAAMLTVLIIGLAVFGLWRHMLQPMRIEAGQVEAGSVTASTDSAMSIAVLPFFPRSMGDMSAMMEQFDPDGDDPLSRLGQMALIDQLQSAAFRVPDTRRIDETIRYLGYRLPLDQSHLTHLAQLLSVSHLAVASYQSGNGQYQLKVELIDTRTRPVTVTTAYSGLVKSGELGGVFVTVAQQIQAQLLTKQQHQQQLEQAKPMSYLYARALSAFYADRLQQADEYLQQLHEESPGNISAVLLSAKIALRQNRWLDLETMLQQVIDGAEPDSREYFQAQILAARSGQQDETVRQLYQSLLKRRPFEHSTRFEFAQWLLTRQDFDAAKQQLQQLLAADKYHGRAWFELSKAAIVSGEIQRALDDYLVQALVISKRLKDKAAQGEVLNAFGVALQRQGDIAQAADYYRQALTLRSDIADQRGVATSLTNLATISSIQGDFSQAQQQLQRALSIWQALEASDGIANTLDKLGILEEERGHYQAALDYYRESLTIRMALADPWSQAESMNNVGFTYFVLSQFDHAKTYLQQAEQAYAELEEPMGAIKVRQSLAQIYLQQGQWDQAYQAFNKTIAAAQTLALKDETVVAKAYLGRLSFEQGRFEQAHQAWLEALRQVEAMQDKRGIVEFSSWLTELYLTLGQQQAAQQILADLQPLLAENVNAEQLLNIKMLEARLQLQQGDLTAVLSLLREVDGAVTEHTPPKVQLKLHLFKQQLALWYPASGLAFDPELPMALRSPYRSQVLQYMQWLELLGHYHSRAGEWAKVEQVINQAIPYLRSMKNYWRRYQFDGLTYQLRQAKGMVASARAYQAAFSRMLQEMPEDWRASFSERQKFSGLSDEAHEPDE